MARRSARVPDRRSVARPCDCLGARDSLRGARTRARHGSPAGEAGRTSYVFHDPRPCQVATRTPPRACIARARGVMLVDSNILIYAAQPACAHLRQFIATHAPAVSAVSYVEVLGYHQLDDEERQYLEAFFRLARV